MKTGQVWKRVNSLSLALITLLSGTNRLFGWQAAAAGLNKPYRVESSGVVVDTGQFNGHSAPAVMDIDGDGLDDLIVGNFGGRFQLHRNVGSKSHPVYESKGYLQAAGADIRLHIECCIGAQPRFADWNGDGLLDLMSNSYDPGHCHLFFGLPGGEFSHGSELLGKDGNPVRSSPLQKEVYESFGSFFESVDWDADGDLDLLVGCFDGSLKLRMNEGDSRAYSFATTNTVVENVDGPIRVKKHCCPVVADWDSDGRWDILTGAEDGSVTFFRNIGATGKPVFSKGELLVEPAEDHWYFRTIIDENDYRPGIRAQIDVTDVNGDGRMDLLLGDYYMSHTIRKNLTSTEKIEVKKLTAAYELSSRDFIKKIASVPNQIEAEFPGDGGSSAQGRERESALYQQLWQSPEGIKFLEDETVFYRSLAPYVSVLDGESPGRENTREPRGHVWVFIRDTKTSEQETIDSSPAEAVKEMSDTDPVRIRVMAKDTLKQGERIAVTVEIEVASGYEIQTARTQPPGVPTKVHFTLPDGVIAIGDLQIPKPSRSVVPSKGSSYSGKAQFIQVVELSGTPFVPGKHAIECVVSYQVCDSKRCLRPVESKIQLPINLTK